MGRGRTVARRDAVCTDASVGVDRVNATVLIGCDVIEVKQIARSGRARRPKGTDNAQLNWIVWGRVDSLPVLTSVDCGRDVAMPDAAKYPGGIVTGCGSTLRRAEEEESGAIVIAGDYLRKRRVLDAEGNAYILVLVP